MICQNDAQSKVELFAKSGSLGHEVWVLVVFLAHGILQLIWAHIEGTTQFTDAKSCH